MKIAVASGKGGTGKTTVACALAQSLGEGACLLDCDVDAPNAHILLHPEIRKTVPASIPLPTVDQELCDGCGRCAEVCEYHALTVMAGRPLLFDHLCHSCGGCLLACPTQAITEKPKIIGKIRTGKAGEIDFVSGELNVGEAMCTPLIRQVKARTRDGAQVIVDSPPGNSCPMVEAVNGSDFCLLVTEPTPFGLNDLALAVKVLEKLGVPFGVVLNLADLGDNRVDRFCSQEDIPILLRIPFDKRIARAYAEGRTLIEARPEFAQRFKELFDDIRRAGRID